MAKNFLDEEIEPASQRPMTYGDGFRLGFGFFIATLLGVILVTLVVLVVNYLMHLK